MIAGSLVGSSPRRDVAARAETDPEHRAQRDDQDHDRPLPTTGEVVHDTEQDRTRRGEEVPDKLGNSGQSGRNGSVGAT